MIRAVVIIVFLLLWIPAAQAQSVVTIDVLENGDSIWIIEKSTPLTSQATIDSWMEFIQNGQDPEQYNKDISNFSERIKWFLSFAQKYSNRSMEVVNFNISYRTTKTLSGDFGIISYSFEWKKFARVDVEKIFIGDLFSEGMLLFTDNVLIIKIPENYDVESVTPVFDKHDGNRLIWDGTLYHGFARGEPALILSRKIISQETLLIAAIIMFLISGYSVILWKKRHAQPYIMKDVNLLDLSPFEREDFSGYEEMIEQYLIKSNGQAYQSDIVEYSKL